MLKKEAAGSTSLGGGGPGKKTELVAVATPERVRATPGDRERPQLQSRSGLRTQTRLGGGGQDLGLLGFTPLRPGRIYAPGPALGRQGDGS